MSGLTEKQYDRNKRARDHLERELVKGGVDREKARKIATETANTTDKKNKDR